MPFDFHQLLFSLESLIFATVVFIQLSKKNSSVVVFYMLQSLVITLFLFWSFLEERSVMLLFVVVVVFAVKVCVAPYFFFRLIREHQLKFSVSTYLHNPMALIIVALLTAFTYSHLFTPLALLSPENANAILLAIAMMLASLFIIINRKGALSQMIGILSFENAIVSFAFLSGLEQAPWLQLGILFDIAVWIVIATVFASIVYQQFGSLDVTTMRHLKEQ